MPRPTTGPTVRRRPDDAGGAASWLTTYADAITLLLAFFVMLYSMSEVDVQKFEAFVAGLAGPFANEATSESLLPPGESLLDAGGIAGPPVDGPPTLDRAAVTPPIDPDSTPATAGASDQLDDVRAQLDAAIAEAGLASVVTMRFDRRGLIISIATDDVLFETGSTRIDDAGGSVIATVAEVLDGVPNDVVVEGHTDNVPLLRGNYTNWNLSTDRAVAVLQLLIDLGLDADRLGAAGYGEHRPVARNDTPARRARNRRVDILTVAQGD